VNKAGDNDQDRIVVTIGVDTHLDIHVAVALDQFGRKLDTIHLPTNGNGHRRLLGWTRSHGVPGVFGIGLWPTFGGVCEVMAAR
jgi:hypothetical protein